MFLLLDRWRESFFDKIWMALKVIIKEGFICQQWYEVKSYFKPRGSVILPDILSTTLKQRNVPFVHNELSNERLPEIIVVAKDTRNLRWALEQKKSGHTKKVIAGPFIVTLPDEGGGILLDPGIDARIFLSKWHRDLFMDLAKVKQNIPNFICYYGVDNNFWKPLNSEKAQVKDQVLVYKKFCDEKVFEEIINCLEDKKVKYQIINCGSYTKNEYLQALQKSYLAIFCQRTETQGMCMFEAWSCNVPSLHWNPGVMRLYGKSFPGASSCPYLSPECGRDFKEAADFRSAFESTLDSLSCFQPRYYIETKFTMAKAADNFLEKLQMVSL